MLKSQRREHKMQQTYSGKIVRIPIYISLGIAQNKLCPVLYFKKFKYVQCRLHHLPARQFFAKRIIIYCPQFYWGV